MKIAYFGFDLFYDCLEEIYKSGNEIVKIFTCKVDGDFETNNKVYNFAYNNAIEITDKKVTKSDVEELSDKGCELLFSAGYYFKIPIIKELPGVNIHPAILPVGRGPWPQPLTILKKLDRTGVTLHKLSADFDSGDILHVREFEVDKQENLQTINQKYLDAARCVTRDFLKSPEVYFINSVRQEKGEYWQEPQKEDMTFSIYDEYDLIDRITRAFYGYFCYINLDNETRKVVKAKCFADKPDDEGVIDLFEISGGWLAILKYA